MGIEDIEEQLQASFDAWVGDCVHLERKKNIEKHTVKISYTTKKRYWEDTLSNKYSNPSIEDLSSELEDLHLEEDIKSINERQHILESLKGELEGALYYGSGDEKGRFGDIGYRGGCLVSGGDKTREGANISWKINNHVADSSTN